MNDRMNTNTYRRADYSHSAIMYCERTADDTNTHKRTDSSHSLHYIDVTVANDLNIHTYTSAYTHSVYTRSVYWNVILTLNAKCVMIVF